MPDVGYNTAYFFDQAAVQKMVAQLGPAGPNLAKAGALLRTIARGSIRRRKKKTTVSRPGSPPYSKEAGANPRFKRIQYYYDHARGGVIVGHVSYPSKAGKYTPDVHEFGGTTQVPRLIVPRKKLSTLTEAGDKRRLRGFRKQLRKLKAGAGQDGVSPQAWKHFGRQRRKPRVKLVRATYAPRPFMAPALTKALPQLPPLWENSIKAG